MRRKTLKKEVTILIFLLTIGSVPYAYALNHPASSLKLIVSENASSEIASCNSEGKPDLIIEDIFLWPSAYPYEYHFECSIRNIGDSPIWKDEFEIHAKIYWMLFGRIPLLPIFSHTTSVIRDGYLFGELKFNMIFASCDILPKFGSYRFYLTVNPNLKIEESDYNNNKYSEDWKVFLGQWKPLI